MRWHYLLHVSPPLLADGRAGHLAPASLIFNLDVTKQLTALRVEKDAVVAGPVRLQGCCQLGPEFIVTATVFHLAAVTVHRDWVDFRLRGLSAPKWQRNFLPYRLIGTMKWMIHLRPTRRYSCQYVPGEQLLAA